MVERKFATIHDYDFKKESYGITVPKAWQAWETAYFYRIISILEHPEAGARLIDYGCDTGDSDTLNCTKTCSNNTLMFSSAENLWNCVTLGTMGMLVSPGNDTINKENEREMDEIFHFGTVEEFNSLNVFRPFRKCLSQSCSDSKYGKCTPGIKDFQCHAVDPVNIWDLGRVLNDRYCRDADIGIDSDIAGPGVLISYIIQYILVMLFGLSFKATTTRAQTSVWKRSIRGKPYEMLTKYQSTVSQTRFAHVVSSTLVDLQEAQGLFTATISIAATVAFAGGFTGLANMPTVFSYIINYDLGRGFVQAGMYPLLMLQLILHRAGNQWWYTLIFLLLNWFCMLALSASNRLDPDSFWENLKEVSAVVACGNNPGPMSYCQRLAGRNTLDFFPILTKFALVVHILTPFLILDWALARINHRYFRNVSEKIHDSWIGDVIWAVLECLAFAMTVIGLHDLIQIYASLNELSGGSPVWSFGQLVALAIWLPVIFRFACLIIVGIKEGVESRIDKDYEVTYKKKASIGGTNSQENEPENFRLIPLLS